VDAVTLLIALLLKTTADEIQERMLDLFNHLSDEQIRALLRQLAGR